MRGRQATTMTYAFLLGACGSQAASQGEDSPARCSDGIDNDLDGLVDCADPRCAAWLVCTRGEDAGPASSPDAGAGCPPHCPSETNCHDNVDEDRDNDIDCGDSDCAEVAACQAQGHVRLETFVFSSSDGAANRHSFRFVVPPEEDRYLLVVAAARGHTPGFSSVTVGDVSITRLTPQAGGGHNTTVELFGVTAPRAGRDRHHPAVGRRRGAEHARGRTSVRGGGPDDPGWDHPRNGHGRLRLPFDVAPRVPQALVSSSSTPRPSMTWGPSEACSRQVTTRRSGEPSTRATAGTLFASRYPPPRVPHPRRWRGSSATLRPAQSLRVRFSMGRWRRLCGLGWIRNDRAQTAGTTNLDEQVDCADPDCAPAAACLDESP